MTREPSTDNNKEKAPGSLRSCNVMGQQIVVNQASSGLMSDSDGYHLDCWKTIEGVGPTGAEK